MTTIKKKNPQYQFSTISESELSDLAKSAADPEFPACCDSETFKVSMGEDDVAILSVFSKVTEEHEELVLTQLYVYPKFRNFGIGTQMLEILSNTGANMLRVLATPSTVRYYENRGFEVDAGQIVLTKVLNV